MKCRIATVLRWLLLLFLLGTTALPQAAPAEVHGDGFMIELEFSVDGGTTFTTNPPVLKRPGEFVVRTKLFCDLEGRSAYMPQLSAPVDFASAGKSRQKWSKFARWYQAAPLPWYNADAKYFDLTVDTRARPAGVIGKGNVWQDGKFVDAPLPPCDALPPGETVFLISVAIRVDKERIVAEKRFPVIITESHRVHSSATSESTVSSSVETSHDVYVSLGGDDDGAGTEGDPYRSIRYALEHVIRGGTMYIAPGVYREGQIEIQRGGTAESPLRIEGAGADQTRIVGSVAVTDWICHAPGVWKRERFATNAQQVLCDGKHLQQIGARTPWNTKVLWADQACLPPRGTGIDDLTPNSFYHDGRSNTLYVMLSDKSDPNQHRMEASVEPSIIRGGDSSHVVIRGLTLGHTNGTHNGGRGSVVSLGESHWTLEDCVVEYGDFCCVNASGRHHTIRRCTIRYGGDVGIESGNTDKTHGWAFYEDAPAQHLLIDDCEISHNNYRGFFAAWHAGGTKFIPASRAVTIRGCRVMNNNGPGLWFDHPLGENVIENNIVTGNEQGIFYEIAAPQGHLKFSARISNNRVSGNSKQGIYVSASSGVQVEDNTVDDNWVGIALHGMPRGEFALQDNTVCRNTFGPAKHAQLIVYVGDGSRNNRVDQNSYQVGENEPTIGVVRGKGYGVTHRDLTRLTAETGMEAGGSTENESN